MNIDSFNSRLKSAEARKQTNWESHYREAMQLFCPNRENFYQTVKGEKKGIQLYTSTPYIALDKSSNNIHSSYTPPQKKFTELKAGRQIPKENREKATEELQAVNDALFSYIFASNFDIAISEFYKDLVIGTAVMLVQGTRDNPLHFTSIPLDQVSFLEGANGIVDTVFRKSKVAYRNIKATWDDAIISKELQATIDKKPDEEVEIIEGTMPQEVTIINRETKKEEKAQGFGYFVKLAKGSSFLVQRELTYNPWIVARWSTMSGEIWGRGPAIVALNDAKTLNQFVKLHMQGLEITVHPVFTVVDDGIINVRNISVKAGVVIPVSANDGVYGPTIKQLTSNIDMNATQIELARLEQSINDQLYTEPLGRVTLPVKTATEISIRHQELAKRIGSAYGRLNHEFRNPFINACLSVLDATGLINMSNFKADGKAIAIESVSPLAQMQSQDEIDNIYRLVEFAVGVYGPQAASAFLPPDKLLPYIGKETNVPVDVMNSAEAVKQAMTALMQGMQQGGEQPQEPQ